VLDTIYGLSSDWAPRKLVSTSKAGMQSGYEIIPAVVDDLRAMHEASAEAGATTEIAIRWAYRSYAEQKAVFAMWVQQSGEQEALKKSARPGHSEHGLGTAIDFRSADSLKAPWDYDDWGNTAPGTWMMENAWRYGFILSYPNAKDDLTCYAYEPWHYRYFGRDLAAQIHDSGLTAREFLWNLAHGG
jgi:zinc D-Ala-D-Ala carboxypeptidase